MPPRWISVALTPVVVLPLTGATVTFGSVADVVPPAAAVVDEAAVAPAVVAGAAVVAGVLGLLLLLHAPRTSSAARPPTMPLLAHPITAPPALCSGAPL